jgi:hypothetical protein
MFFANLFVLVGRRALLGGGVLRRVKIHSHPAALPIAGCLALRAQRAVAALPGTELIVLAVPFFVRVFSPLGQVTSSPASLSVKSRGWNNSG